MLRRTTLVHGRMTLALAALMLLGPAACKKGGSTKSPGAGGEANVAAAKSAAKSSSLVDLANGDLSKGRYVSASKRAEEALAANPNNAIAYAVLGAAKWRAGDFAASTDAYRKALDIDAKDFAATLGLARNLQAINHHKEAIELADKLLAIEKDQIDPMLVKLWSLYALLDAEAADKLLDDIFKYVPRNDPQLPLIQARAAFVRPLKDKGKLAQVEGTAGTTDLEVDINTGLKHAGVVAAGSSTRAVVLEIREESSIDPGLVKKLKLTEVGTYKPLGSEEDVPIVIVPEIKIGKITIKNLPCVVQSLADYAGGVGSTPGLMLGRQALLPFGTVTFDFPGNKLELAVDAPASAPAGSSEVPLLFISMHVVHAPAVPITIDDSGNPFFVYFGGVYRSGVAITEKQFLKSKHLPREVVPPDDAEQGLKMVFIDKLQIGDVVVQGVGGLVLLNDPPDPNLDQFLQTTAFELGGYLNLTLLKNWNVTYALSQGKAYIAAPTAE